MGTTKEIFQLVGGQPHAMEQLNNYVSDGAIALAVEFNIIMSRDTIRPICFGYI